VTAENGVAERRYSKIIFGHRHGFGNSGDCGGEGSATSRFAQLTLIPKPSASRRRNARREQCLKKIKILRGDATKLSQNRQTV